MPKNTNKQTSKLYGATFQAFVYESNSICGGGQGSRGVVVRVVDCDRVISVFEIQSRYDVHLRTNLPWEK